MANWKSNYSKARNATWFYYLLALMFFVFAVQAFPRDGGSMLRFVMWCALATGMVFGAGRNKRNAKKDART